MVCLCIDRCKESIGMRSKIHQSVSSNHVWIIYKLCLFLFKAYYRRASAYMALGKYTSALSDYEYVC